MIHTREMIILTGVIESGLENVYVEVHSLKEVILYGDHEDELNLFSIQGWNVRTSTYVLICNC